MYANEDSHHTRKNTFIGGKLIALSDLHLEAVDLLHLSPPPQVMTPNLCTLESWDLKPFDERGSLSSRSLTELGVRGPC